MESPFVVPGAKPRGSGRKARPSASSMKVCAGLGERSRCAGPCGPAPANLDTGKPVGVSAGRRSPPASQTIRWGRDPKSLPGTPPGGVSSALCGHKGVRGRRNDRMVSPFVVPGAKPRGVEPKGSALGASSMGDSRLTVASGFTRTKTAHLKVGAPEKACVASGFSRRLPGFTRTTGNRPPEGGRYRKVFSLGFTAYNSKAERRLSLSRSNFYRNSRQRRKSPFPPEDLKTAPGSDRREHRETSYGRSAYFRISSQHQVHSPRGVLPPRRCSHEPSRTPRCKYFMSSHLTVPEAQRRVREILQSAARPPNVSRGSGKRCFRAMWVRGSPRVRAGRLGPRQISHG